MQKYLCVLVTMIFCSCNTIENQDSNAFNVNDIKKSWTNSFEEEMDTFKIYRPSNNMHFPAAWYRQKYAFTDDGKCSYLVLAQNDYHYFVGGTWNYETFTNTVSIFDSLQQIVTKFKLLELSDNILKFSKIK